MDGMAEVSEKRRSKWIRAFWHVMGYQPSEGDFPIHDLEKNLVVTSYGQKEFHDDSSRIKLLAGGVRAGKSMVLAMEAAKHLLVEDGLCWILGPDYEQAKAEFKYLVTGIERLGYLKSKSVPERGAQKAETTFGYRLETKSTDDLESIASFAPNLILVTEVNQQPNGILEKAYERGLQNDAPILAGGTFERSSQWFQNEWERFQGPNDVEAHSFSLPSWSNPKEFPGGRNDRKILTLEKLLGPELFLERCAAIPSKPTGLVHRAFSHKKHVRRIDFDPLLPIEIAIDPGQHTYAVLALQWEKISGQYMHDLRTGLSIPLEEVRVVDEVYCHGMIAQDVIPLVKAKPWFKYVKSGTIDVAGRQQAANKSQIQIWHEMTGRALRSKYIFITEGIDVLNLRLRDYPGYGKPLVAFDYRLSNEVQANGKAKGIIGEMGLYKWPEQKEGTSEKRRPIDNNNDACKALSYWMYDRYGPVEARRTRPRQQFAAYC